MTLLTIFSQSGKYLLLSIFAFLLISCSESSPPALTTTADSIYFGGTIITLNDAQPSAEAVAIKDGKIIAVGRYADIEKSHKSAETRLIDLHGKTLIPGFIDGHSHFSEVGAQTVLANLLPPPDGSVKNIADLQKTMRDFIATSPIVKKHGVAIGMNYDDSQLAEHRHPTRHDLDAISTELPIMVSHQSGHFGALNSKALEKVGITADSIAPDGGVIRREADGKTPNGVLEENAFFGVVYKMFPAFTPDEIAAQLQASEKIYLANGFTTIQDGKTTKDNLKLLMAMSEAGTLKADVVSYPDIVTFGDDPLLQSPLMSRHYKNHLRMGGVKLTLDGSPQGKTGWFTVPYFKVPEGQPETYAGYPAFSDEKLNEWILLAYKNNWQVLGHCSGDAAVEQFINAVRNAQKIYPGTNHRPVIIHGHFIRADQVPAIKELGIFVSAFPLHTFNWGDWHRESVVGPERAENISPTGWFLTQDVPFSIHSDAPVIFPDSMKLIGTAVNRTTRSGYVLGAEHRLEPLAALKAMTLSAAYQHFEEATKGSIEVGKLADFVVLAENPLTKTRANLKQIRVLETIKEGKSVYRSTEDEK
ncbi:amidohydrolase [Cellvibrio mixtus]|uniref:Amidohydrolase n=1 Tax=Cellvibrio mixtus TaxID=39650 RepID=A0A266Q8H4_9GAMM|nr:amidohydrolase [Cellvibrio mixtus]OZY86120.1 amidohydrolase [Cellvibrio mixtus]